ncbi:hypothetical protein [Streptomyces sp. NPDC059003]|uniref:hypothetical protein n=1 Tax=Streptomyces sp. NPDC059003 TaxID=3346691 RepID=UPI0036A16E3B
MEVYADQVTEADNRYQELQQIHQLTDDRGDVLELLASTVRDDLAVAELSRMTEKSATVAATFTAALDAAVIALPLRKTA